MKAQVIHAFGDPSVFTMIDLPIPKLKPGHVLIKVHATSANPIDCKVRSGAISEIAPEFPAILHGDVSGTIEAVGDGVHYFKKGDEIYGCAGGFCNLGGALAEYMLADARLISKKPQSLSMSEAAALPLVSITAWMALFEKAKVISGKNVLIHSGVGGVGHVAIQLAKWSGAKVFTTVRKHEDFAIVKSFGTDEIINAQEEDVAQYKKRLTNDCGFEIIFDTVGGSNLDKSFAAATTNGTIVTIAARSTHDLTPMHSKGLSLHCVLMLLPLLNGDNREEYGRILEKIAHIVDEGKLKPLLDPHHYTLDKVDQAHELLESGRANGKIVISVIN
ncbi:MAG: zinc-dependent alcohol dehydrogenase family protein [Gammaproteobacteria bacterium]|nr:zinc-dependent alcohol dehydrogenase family protein [Gammaproteobacteria bacterium]MCW5584137.1 zinc-dependent alcohol dehydrogenase family protein [Gammaproteobacteria bacterium]